MDLEGEMFYIQFLDLFFELKPSLRTMVVSSSDTDQREIKAALDIRYNDLCRNQGNLLEVQGLINQGNLLEGSGEKI